MTNNAEFWLEKDNLILLNGWKRNGLTDEQIAENMGISRRTFYNWRNKYPQIEKVTKLGKEHANFAVENALFKKAIGGNTTAMIFWLKNNWRSKYSDSPKTDIELEEVKKRLEIMEIEKQIKKNQLELGSELSDVNIEFIEVKNDEQDD